MYKISYIIVLTRNLYIVFTYHHISEVVIMPGEDTKTPPEVKFIFKKADGYKQCYINGAYGTFNPRGDFVCDFFYEFKELPTEQIADVNEETGQLDYKTKSPSELTELIPEFVREVRLGIVISPQQLINLRDWLDKMIEEYKKSIK